MKKIKVLFVLMAFLVASASTAVAQDSYSSDMQSKTIVEISSQTDNLSTLVKAVKAAGLVKTLSSEGPFTVFAPTNQAFANLPKGTLEMLLMSENQDKLKSILTYHVVPGKIMSSELKDGQWVETVQGNKIKISITDNGVKINDASVITADVKASNGVIHIIDTVLMSSDNSKDNYSMDKKNSDW